MANVLLPGMIAYQGSSCKANVTAASVPANAEAPNVGPNVTSNVMNVTNIEARRQPWHDARLCGRGRLAHAG